MITKRQLFGTLLLFVGMLGLFTACGESGDDNEKKEAGSANLRVTPGSLKFSASGGNQSLSVSTTYDYLGAETSADWLDYDFNDALSTLYVTASANPTDAVRNATLTIMGSNDGETIAERVTIKVEQEAGEGDTGTVFTVGPNGGKVELGDLTIDFPSGTFNTSAKITVSEVEKGAFYGDGELSKYYKIKLSEGVRQIIQVSVKSEKYAFNDYVKMMFTTNGWAPSIDKDVITQHIIDVKYAEGAYFAEIPAMENPGEEGEKEAYFGLTSEITKRTESSRTRADSPILKHALHMAVGLITPFMSLDEVIAINTNQVLFDSLDNIIIPTAIKQLEDLGFRKGSKAIHYYANSFWGDVMFTVNESYGCLDKSIWGKELGVIYLNKGKMSLENLKTIKETVIHETFHYYQQFYGDTPRGHHLGTILDEAAAVWSERFCNSGIEGGSENIDDNIYISVASLNRDHYSNVKTNKSWSDYLIDGSYQNIGYGMAPLLEYLSRKLNNSIILKMYEERKARKNKDDRLNSLDIVGKTAKDNGLDIFTQKAYYNFIEQLGTYNIYKGIGFGQLISNRVKQDTIGQVKRDLTNEKPVYFTNYAYDYGALIEELTVVPDKFNGGQASGLDNTSCIIEQTTTGLTTWVYKSEGLENQRPKYKLIGETKKDSPLDVSSSFVKQNGVYGNQKYILVTIRNDDNFKSSKEILSRIVTKVDKINKVFDKFKTLSLDVSGTCNYKGNWFEGSYVEKEKRVSYQMSLWDQKPNVEISHNANFVKISLNLKIDNSLENTDYNVILNIDATKNIITSLEAKKTSSISFFHTSENAIIRVENIPLMKVDGKNNYISDNGYGSNCVGKKDGVKMLEFHWFTGTNEVNDDWKWDGADDYQIFIDILLND